MKIGRRSPSISAIVDKDKGDKLANDLVLIGVGRIILGVSTGCKGSRSGWKLGERDDFTWEFGLGVSFICSVSGCTWNMFSASNGFKISVASF
jgi:hypothetical protein